MRNNFVVTMMFIVCSVLAPVLWYLWIYAGSANANFYFAFNLVYGTAQVKKIKVLNINKVRKDTYLVFYFSCTDVCNKIWNL